MKQILFTAAFLSLFTVNLFSQAGKDTYQFLNLPTGARTAAFGGTNVSLYDDDLNFAFCNPALLSKNTHNILGLNYVNYIADINFGSVIYGRNYGKNYFGAGINYIDYGTFLETDEYDTELGNFTAKDYVLSFIYAHPLSNEWTIGGALKPIYSVYERYSSYGIGMDFGVSYHDSLNLFSAGLVIRNVGWQFTGYYSINGDQHKESLPLNIELGATKKLAHAPLRFTVTLHDLQHWDLSYTQSQSVIDYNNDSVSVGFGDMLFRHMNIAVELLPTKNFYIVASYNHRRKAEMKNADYKSIAGFAFGAGLKIYKFQTGFSIVSYQVGTLSYHFTLSTSLSEFGIK